MEYSRKNEWVGYGEETVECAIDSLSTNPTMDTHEWAIYGRATEYAWSNFFWHYIFMP